jgi:hypothetical protein
MQSHQKGRFEYVPKNFKKNHLTSEMETANLPSVCMLDGKIQRGTGESAITSTQDTRWQDEHHKSIKLIRVLTPQLFKCIVLADQSCLQLYSCPIKSRHHFLFVLIVYFCYHPPSHWFWLI